MKKQSIKSILTIIIFTGLGLFLVWLSLKDISKEEIFTAFSGADVKWIFACIIISLLSHVSRAIRWQILMEPLGHKTGFVNTFASVMIGYLANYGIPRIGEVTRCTVLAKYEKVPFQQGFGTVIIERTIDVVSLLLVLLLTLLFQFETFGGIIRENIYLPFQQKIGSITAKPLLLYSLIGAGIIGLGLLFLLRKKIKQLLSGKFGNLISGFADGIKSISKLHRPWQFLFHSFLIWALYYLGIFVCFYCYDETLILGWKECLAILLCGTFGVMVTTGGLGAYHIIVQNLLQLYGISLITSKAFPWIVWGSGFIVVIITGSLFLILLPIINKNKT